MIRRFLSLGFLLMFGAVPGWAQVLVTGTVVDATDGAGLAAAHVRVAGTTVGTITNAEGRFSLNVARLPVTLEVRYIGYETAQVEATTDQWQDLTIRLEPRVYELGEVTVATPDFAANIMRRVIARKQAMREQLATLAAQGFTRLTLSRDGEIILLAESVFDVYRDRDRGPREVITAERQTAGFHTRLGIPSAGHIPNFYDDLIPVRGLRMIGPTHPQALAIYTFTLARTRALGDEIVYDFYVAPKTALEPAFIGTISVLDEVYALVEVHLRPARYITFPEPTEAWDVFYHQQYMPVDSIWLPVDLRLDGTARVTPDGMRLEAFRIEQTSRLSNYQINVPLPEEPYASAERVTMDTSAVMSDPLFLAGRAILPMTPREEAALARLQDRPMTLAALETPTRGVAAFLSRLRGDPFDKEGPQFTWPLIRGVYQPAVRFNRVDGYLGAIGTVTPLTDRLAVDWQLGQASGFERIRYHAGARYRWGRGGSVAATYDVDTAHRYASHVYPSGLNTITTLFGAGDYFDYLWSKRLHVDVRYALPLVRFGAGVRYAVQESVERRQRRAWLGEVMRENPPIEAGELASVVGSIAIGDARQPLRTGPVERAEVQIEHSLVSPGERFTRFDLALDGSVPTFYRRRLRPNTLAWRVFATASIGTLPPQRFATLDGTIGVFGAFGAFRSLRGRPYEGDRALGVFWAHDFRTVPFELLGLRALVDRDMGVRLFGAHGRTWFDEERLPDLPFTPLVAGGWHHEVGASLTNVFGTPLRVDLTRRLDRPGWFVTIGLSRLPR